MPETSTSPSRAKTGDNSAPSAPVRSDHCENSASTIIESPMSGKRRDPLDAHAFPDGGGSGGAEAFRRRPILHLRKKA